MKKRRIYYPRTTASQRQRLFEVWQETGDVAQACDQARVSERTFYNWKARFEAGGYQALEEFAAAGPKQPHRTGPEIEQKVIEMKRTQPEWGKERIAQELAKPNNWLPLISPNTVRRILIEAGLWQPSQTAGKKGAMNPLAAVPKNLDKR
jgi:transposase